MSTSRAPFKFLDAYGYEDYAHFFGRTTEVEALYEAVCGVKHLLVYGPTGAGKTSLIECGLRNQYSKADWFALTIRRGEQLVPSFYATINAELEQPVELSPATGRPTDASLDFSAMTRKLFQEKYIPIYLLFDQFEELLLLGSLEEQTAFFTQINQLIHERLPCRVLLVMREEFIGHLSAFEHLLPGIFEQRFRLEKMGRQQVREVIGKMLTAPVYQRFYRVQHQEQLVDRMLHCLPDEQQEIALTHVQVFLHELWQRAKAAQPHTLPVLAAELIRETDNLGAILNDFLHQQLADLQTEVAPQLPLELLATMISDQHTKLQRTVADMESDLHKNEVAGLAQLPVLVDELERRRIIRSAKAGTTTRYEISHDLLASAVGDNLTEEIRQRQRAIRTYRVYQERSGFFSREEMAHLNLFSAYRKLPADLQERIAASQAHWQAAEQAELLVSRRRANRLAILLSLVLVGLVGTLFFFWRAEQRKRAAVEANTALQWQLATVQKTGGNYVAAQNTLLTLDKSVDQPTTSLAIRDTIAVWQRVDSFVQLAARHDSLRSTPPAYLLLRTALALSSDGNLRTQYVTYQRSYYDRCFDDANRKYVKGQLEDYESLVRAMVATRWKTETQIRTAIEGD
ncbi:MAG: ATP-binding protein [Bacteroidota bacterium]